jgi:hypothetical protein
LAGSISEIITPCPRSPSCPRSCAGLAARGPRAARRGAQLDALSAGTSAVGASVERLCDAIRESSLGAASRIGVTPDTLLIDGVAADAARRRIAEAAALLHDRDILTITFSATCRDGVTGLLRC